MRSISLILIFCLSSILLLGQNVNFNIVDENEVDGSTQDLLVNIVDFESKDSVSNLLVDLIEVLHGKGYLGAAIDRWVVKDQVLAIDLYLGPKVSFIHLADNVVGDSVNFLKHQSYNDYISQRKLFLNTLANKGYPFAALKFQDVEIIDDTLSASLVLTKGPLVEFGGVIIHDSIRLSEVYLEQYLGIEAGAVYDKSLLYEVDDLLDLLPFVERIGVTEVVFQSNKAYLKPNIKILKTSKFNFIVGAQPEVEDISTGVEKLTLTGSFLLELINTLGRGERGYIAFDKLKPRSQFLDVQVDYPYLFKLPFSINSGIAIDKQDTIVLDVDLNVGLQFSLHNYHKVNTYWARSTSRLIEVNKPKVIESRLLPEEIGSSYSGFGVNYKYIKIDNPFVARKGLYFNLDVNLGNKKLQKNSQIEGLIDEEDQNFDFSSLYEGLILKSFESKVALKVSKLFPVFKRSTISLNGQFGAIYNSSAFLSRSDLHQLGGLNNFRGFDQSSLFVDQYGLIGVEYRRFIGLRSFLFAFVETGFLNNRYEESLTQNKQTYSFGSGLTLNTKLGDFNIAYALGAIKGNGLDLSVGKIHFGYLSYF